MDRYLYPGRVLAADIPKVTDWMQAWGSLLGAGVSTLAVIITGLLLLHEVHARREEKQDSDAAQARLVIPSIQGFSRYVDGKPWAVGHVDWAVVNYSAAPILDLRARLFRGTDLAAVEDDGCDLVEERYVGGFVLREVIDSAEEDPPPTGFSVEIEFTDAAGLVWRRREREKPVRVIPRRRLTWWV